MPQIPSFPPFFQQRAFLNTELLNSFFFEDFLSQWCPALKDIKMCSSTFRNICLVIPNLVPTAPLTVS